MQNEPRPSKTWTLVSNGCLKRGPNEICKVLNYNGSLSWHHIISTIPLVAQNIIDITLSTALESRTFTNDGDKAWDSFACKLKEVNPCPAE